MKLALVAVEEAVYFRYEAEDTKDAVEEEDLADVAEVYLVVAMQEEETMGAVDKILERCDAMMDYNWRFIRHMTLLTMNGTGYLRYK